MWFIIVAIELTLEKVNIKGVESTPPTNTGEQTSGENLLTTLVHLVRGVFCTDTPLTEIIPPPTEVSQSTASRNGMSESRSEIFKVENRFVLCSFCCMFNNNVLTCIEWFFYSTNVF